MVNSNFKWFWVVTIPLTLLVLSGYKIWMWRNRDKMKAGHEPLRTERVMAYQKKVNESMEMNTPFYPGKGSPGHLLWGAKRMFERV
jgi:hypothetical protein